MRIRPTFIVVRQMVGSLTVCVIILLLIGTPSPSTGRRCQGEEEEVTDEDEYTGWYDSVEFKLAAALIRCAIGIERTGESVN